MKHTVLITGASTGIGLATAKTLVERGYRVLAGARKQEDLDKLEKEIGAIPIRLDVTKAEHIRNLEKTLQNEDLYALINNAGIAVHGPVECVPMEEYRLQFEVNFFGLIAVTQVALPHIRKSKGRVINVSSISGRSATPFMSPYSSSKFAVEALTDALRREMSSLGVKVVSINPGFIKTPILEKPRPPEESEKIFFKKPGQREAYKPGLEALAKFFYASIPNADPVSIVTNAMVHALESKRPKTRYYLGRGIRIAASMNAHLPDRWIDKLLWQQLRKP